MGVQLLLIPVYIATALLFALTYNASHNLMPFFILLVHFYFSLYNPKYTGYFWALTNGLMWDLITGDPLGLHSIILILLTGFTVRYNTFRHYSIFKQIIVIGLIVIISQLCETLLHYFNFKQTNFEPMNLLWNFLINGVFWIWVSPTCRIINDKINYIIKVNKIKLN